eukprot:c8379_g1_i1.p1 GENE.c8379_g1_i1~~c8379_g1_i1.p1  ORF type:complete len:607 (+),score=189.99 c8379_g1_i1:48-1868(+)
MLFATIVKELYEVFDTDGDGLIFAKDFVTQFHITRGQAEALIIEARVLDGCLPPPTPRGGRSSAPATEESGLSLAQFQRLLAEAYHQPKKQKEQQNSEKYRKVFEKLDVDASGKLTMDKLGAQGSFAVAAKASPTSALSFDDFVDLMAKTETQVARAMKRLLEQAPHLHRFVVELNKICEEKPRDDDENSEIEVEIPESILRLWKSATPNEQNAVKLFNLRKALDHSRRIGELECTEEQLVEFVFGLTTIASAESLVQFDDFWVHMEESHIQMKQVQTSTLPATEFLGNFRSLLHLIDHDVKDRHGNVEVQPSNRPPTKPSKLLEWLEEVENEAQILEHVELLEAVVAESDASRKVYLDAVVGEQYIVLVHLIHLLHTHEDLSILFPLIHLLLHTTSTHKHAIPVLAREKAIVRSHELLQEFQKRERESGGDGDEEEELCVLLMQLIIESASGIAKIEDLQLSEQQLSDFKSAFELFDKDGDGAITLSELQTVMGKLNLHPTIPQLRAMILEADVDGSGKIEFTDFVQLMSNQYTPNNPDDEIYAAFKVFDRDGNGVITKEELREVMESLGEDLSKEDLDALMREADTDGNGQMDYQEFRSFILSL